MLMHSARSRMALLVTWSSQVMPRMRLMHQDLHQEWCSTGPYACTNSVTCLEFSSQCNSNTLFINTSEGVFLHNCSIGKLFSLARLKANTKIRKVLISEMHFADDAAVISQIMT